MKTLALMVLLVASLAGLAGCGQKGPLYLPDDAPAIEQSDEQPSRAAE
ncbi:MULTISPECIES: LPS translocon maturation chaperone LptM [Halomonadaceae]|uniref:Lipoprotein n=1 Tax=Halomonas casei TaxID=2742613 RepID=A0ABR9F188_9GAMM|nr:MULTISPECIES: lipoprotein [Halomonas]MBE0400230.1 lipoprotein [Halomonas casei]PCC21088.1 hypothetical protein CIK78_02755 [Halomonas sp. JB37]